MRSRTTALLVQQEKQPAFGLLAAGIAHEVGNPLAAINSPTHLLAEIERVLRHARLLSAALGQAAIGAEPVLPIGLGNAVNPLTSLTFPFRIPLLLITTQRGEPGVPDEPQHALMGAVTEDLLRVLRVGGA